MLPDCGLIGIVGKSGSGKSTLLNIIASFDKPSCGRVFYNNVNICDVSDEDISKYRQDTISVLLQESTLIEDMTVFENISLPLLIGRYNETDISNKVHSVCEELGIESLELKYPNRLSGGEKQRVGLARSLVTDPKVLLCDECTSGLDDKNAVFVMKKLKELSSTKLVLLISHNQKLVDEYCDYFVRLDKGRVVENNIQNFERKNKKANKPRNRKLKRNKWAKKIAVKYFKENIKRNSFAFIACYICFLLCFTGVGFVLGSPSAVSKQEKKSLINTYSLAYKKETHDIDNSVLTLVKNKTPENEEVFQALDFSNDVEVVDNLSFMMPEGGCVKNGTKEVCTEFYPILSSRLSSEHKKLLSAGTTFQDEDIGKCYVNEQFQKEYGENCVNKVFEINHKLSFKVEDEIIEKDLLYKFKVVGVVEELAFLNSPHIYYSYKGLLNFSRLEIVDGISMYNRIVNSDLDSPLRSFSKICFAKNSSGINLLKNINNKTINSVEFSNIFFTTLDAFDQLIKSIESCIIPFLMVSALMIVIFISFVTYSSILEKQKELLIIRSHGGSEIDIARIFAYETLMVIGMAYTTNLILYKLFELKMNNTLFKQTGLTNIISFPYINGSGIPFGYIILSILALLFVICAVCYCFTYYSNKKSLSTELKK